MKSYDVEIKREKATVCQYVKAANFKLATKKVAHKNGWYGGYTFIVSEIDTDKTFVGDSSELED